MIQNISELDAGDKDEAVKRLGGNEELFQELVQIFVEESPKLIRKLQQAVCLRDSEAIMRGAHSLKGELNCLGGMAAAKTAQALETMGRHKELAGASEALARLERELTDLTRRLREAVTTHP